MSCCRAAVGLSQTFISRSELILQRKIIRGVTSQSSVIHAKLQFAKTSPRSWVSNAVIISNTQAIVALRRKCHFARASDDRSCSSQPVFNSSWLGGDCD